jgi:hypothetical protein
MWLPALLWLPYLHINSNENTIDIKSHASASLSLHGNDQVGISILRTAEEVLLPGTAALLK